MDRALPLNRPPLFLPDRVAATNRARQGAAGIRLRFPIASTPSNLPSLTLPTPVFISPTQSFALPKPSTTSAFSYGAALILK